MYQKKHVCVLIILFSIIVACRNAPQESQFVPEKGRVLTFVHELDYVNYAQENLPGTFGVAFYAALNQETKFSISTNKKIEKLENLLNYFDNKPVLIMLRLTNTQIFGITQGKNDSLILGLAQTLKNYSSPIYLGIGYEVNNPRYMLVAQNYVPVFQKIVKMFRSQGVKNVSYVWHIIGMKPRYDDSISLNECFPGKEYVDWVGLSIHNITQTHFPQDSYFEGPIYDQIKEFAADYKLPIMICESSTRSVKKNFGFSGDSLWTDWYAPFFKFINEFDVRGMTHIFYSFEDKVILTKWQEKMKSKKYVLGKK